MSDDDLPRFAATKEFVYRADLAAWGTVVLGLLLVLITGQYLFAARTASVSKFASAVLAYTMILFMISSLWSVVWTAMREEAEERRDLLEESETDGE